MKPPAPKGMELLRTIWSFQRDPLATLARVTARYSDIVSYGKRHSPFYKMLRYFLGDGLLTSDGGYWLRQRRLAQPAFQRKKIEAMAPIIVRCTEEMVQGWRQLPPGTRPCASLIYCCSLRNLNSGPTLRASTRIDFCSRSRAAPLSPSRPARANVLAITLPSWNHA